MQQPGVCLDPKRTPSELKSAIAGTFAGRLHLLVVQFWTHHNPVDPMKKILLASVATLAFAAPSFAAETAKTVGQAPPSAASSFYLAQDTTSMKCQVVGTLPANGGSMKVIGTAHSTQAEAQTALTADKTCK